MNDNEILEMLNGLNVVIKDTHVVNTSGRHSNAYFNKDAIYPHTDVTSRLCAEIADHFKGDAVDVVIAPAIGAVILSQWVAWHLTDLCGGKEVLGVYAERSASGEHFVIKRGYDKLVKGKRVMVVEDSLTTGGSARRVVEAVRGCGGTVVGVGALCNRGRVTVDDLGSVPKLIALVNMPIDSWPLGECPLCKKRVPINTDVGKGREFLSRFSSWD